MWTQLLGGLGITVLLGHAASAPVARMAQPTPPDTILAVVDLPFAVWAFETILPAGEYGIRHVEAPPRFEEGRTVCGSCWMEFLERDVVRGREQATIIGKDEAAMLFKGPRPPDDGARLDVLDGGAYVRIWINRGRTDYVISLFAAPPPG